MKKHLILLCLLLSGLFQNDLSAQNTMGFAPPNAEWWHKFDITYSSEPLIYAFVKGDTVIDGISARQIGQILYFKNHQARKIDTLPRSDLYIYDTEDTVFVYNDIFNRFTPLYVFNVKEGDTVCLPVITARPGYSDLKPNPFANGDTSFCFIIDSIRTLLYDTVYLETIFQHSIIDIDYSFPVFNWHPHASGGLTPTGAYTRLTGGLFGGLLPTANEPVITYNRKPAYESYIYDGLRCYKDDSVSISTRYGSCFFEPFPVKIDEIEPEMDISLFPNPSKGTVILKSEVPLPANTSLFVTDISGRMLQALESPAGKTKSTYQLNELAPGMYFLVFVTDKERHYKKIVLTGK